MIWGVADIETTGLSSDKNEICELAMVLANNTEIIDIYHNFFEVKQTNPQAEEVNGLSFERLKGCPSIFSELDTIRSLIPKKLFAHNSRFDSGFMLKAGIVDNTQYWVDTVKLCKLDGLKLENNKLVTWLKYYRINHRSHGALSDALGLYQLIRLKGWQIR